MAFAFSTQAFVSSWQAALSFPQATLLLARHSFFSTYVNAGGQAVYQAFQVGHYFFFQMLSVGSHFL
jgi:hypothetical protein